MERYSVVTRENRGNNNCKSRQVNNEQLLTRYPIGDLGWALAMLSP